MKIDLYGSANTESTKELQTTTLAKSAGPKSQFNTQSATQDQATLSYGADSVQALATTALGASSARSAKVSMLKQAVNSAQYPLDSAKIAQAISSADV